MIDNPYGQVVFISGASTGIGRATALLLMKNGFKVYGTSRTERPDLEAQDGEGFIKMLKMDVQDEGSVRDAIRRATGRDARLDILINNAGWGVAGSVEDTAIEEVQKQMAINFTGAATVMKYSLPMMRKAGKGLVLNISSVGGFLSLAYQGYYSASKFAIEALSEAAYTEIKPFGIKICCIEPADTKTEFTASRKITRDALVNEAYKKEFLSSLKKIEDFEHNGKDPSVVADVILKMIKKKNPPIRRAVGLENRFIYVLKKLLPAKLVMNLLARLYIPGKIIENAPAPEN